MDTLELKHMERVEMETKGRGISMGGRARAVPRGLSVNLKTTDGKETMLFWWSVESMQHPREYHNPVNR